MSPLPSHMLHPCFAHCHLPLRACTGMHALSCDEPEPWEGGQRRASRRGSTAGTLPSAHTTTSDHCTHHHLRPSDTRPSTAMSSNLAFDKGHAPQERKVPQAHRLHPPSSEASKLLSRHKRCACSFKTAPPARLYRKKRATAPAQVKLRPRVSPPARLYLSFTWVGGVDAG